MYLLSVFGGGLFIFPLGFLFASALSFYKANKQWKSGSTWNEDSGSGPLTVHESNKRVKFFSIASARFGVAFFVGAVVIIIVMLGDK